MYIHQTYCISAQQDLLRDDLELINEPVDKKLLAIEPSYTQIPPGVCMMQMVKETLESVIGKETNLVKAADMKFLAVINPVENNLIHASIKYSSDESGNTNVVASLFKDELVHFKFKGQFVSQN